MKLAYHASHEQFAPSHLLKLALLAEKAGFEAIHSSDHFNPWSERQGHSGFSFSWVASVLQATSLPVSMLCTPGQRYHPAVVAQAIATMAEMYPDRLTVEMATGENLNESVTGDKWLPKTERNKRLEHSVTAIRRLLNGETVSINNSIRMIGAKVWSLPETQPPLYCAAISAETAAWCGSWADGLITVAGSREETMEKITAFHDNGGIGKPVSVQYSFSYADSKEAALEAAHEQWRSNLLPREKLADLSNTLDFDRMTANISKEEVEEKVPLITSMEELQNEIKKLKGIGIGLISLHNVNRNHEAFIEAFSQSKMAVK